MAQCLGGTPARPQQWVRFTPDGDREERGRVEGCKVQGNPTPASCYGCPAFRGVDRDGIVRDILAPNGDLVAMTAAEHEAWQDDPEAFFARRADGSIWNLRHSGTLEWDEHWAAYQRAYYARMDDEQRARRRAKNAEAAARYRRRNRHLNHPRGGEDVGVPPGRAGHARARDPHGGSLDDGGRR